LGEGTSKFVLGATVGALGGFAIGALATTPTARSARQTAFGGIDLSTRFLGRTVVQAVDGLGSIAESAYTRIRGREKYLEHEIDDLREQIARLQQKIAAGGAPRPAARSGFASARQHTPASPRFQPVVSKRGGRLANPPSPQPVQRGRRDKAGGRFG
jgi:hypothetical protein